MNRKHAWIGITLVSLLTLGCLFAAKIRASPELETAARRTQIAAEKKIWDAGLATPIRFYGKVVDEKGIPISEANVHVSMHDHLLEGYSKKELLSDKDGLFTVSGHGLGLGVMVSKGGYYHLKESDGTFGYAEGAGTGAPHPDPSNPAIFVLRKMGTAAPLVRVKGDFRIPKNGTPVLVDLGTGRATGGSNQAIKVECWTNDQKVTNPNLNIPYDWRCQLTVPGGGVVKREGQFDFVAPEGGYQPVDEIDMPASLGTKWRSQVTRDYFVKLGNGEFARLNFMMTAGGDHFFSITSYLNPSGSKNLEYDPAKQANTQ